MVEQMFEQDKDNMRQVIGNFPSQFERGFKLASHIRFDGVESVVVAGMGGSAFYADLAKEWLGEELTVPLSVHRNYSLPAGVNEKTLFIASSYSGNTEECLDGLEKALRIKAKIAGISSGGKVKEFCEKHSLPLALMPSGIQPRSSTGFMFSALIAILQNSRLIGGKSGELSSLGSFLEANKSALEHEGQKLAVAANGKIPVVYASQQYASVARVCKIKFNENSKTASFYNVFPELNHNEMNGTRFADKMHFFFIENPDDHPRVKKRMQVTRKLLESQGAGVSEITPLGKSRLERMFSALYLFEWASFHLAMEYGVDPTSVELVEKLKKELG